MTTATTLGGPLYAVPAVPAQQGRFRLLLSLRRRARQALDRMLSAPQAAAAFIGRLAHHRLLRRLTAAGASLVGRLSPAVKVVRSVGLVPIGLAALCSPTGQRLTVRAVQGAGRLLGRLAQGLMRAVYRGLSHFGDRGVQTVTKLQFATQRGAEALRAAVAPWLPRLQAGVAVLGIVLDVTRPLVRGLLVHRVLTRLVPSRLFRAALELLVAPALVDGRVGRWIRATAARLVGRLRGALRLDAVVIVTPRVAAHSAAVADVGDTKDPEADAEVSDAPAPQNRAERREAQRQQSLAKRHPRSA